MRVLAVMRRPSSLIPGRVFLLLHPHEHKLYSLHFCGHSDLLELPPECLQNPRALSFPSNFLNSHSSCKQFPKTWQLHGQVSHGHDPTSGSEILY